MKGDKRYDRKQTPAMFESALKEWELTFSYLGNTSANAN